MKQIVIIVGMFFLSAIVGSTLLKFIVDTFKGPTTSASVNVATSTRELFSTPTPKIHYNIKPEDFIIPEISVKTQKIIDSDPDYSSAFFYGYERFGSGVCSEEFRSSDYLMGACFDGQSQYGKEEESVKKQTIKFGIVDFQFCMEDLNGDDDTNSLVTGCLSGVEKNLANDGICQDSEQFSIDVNLPIESKDCDGVKK